MHPPDRKTWLAVVLVVGVGYLVAGLVFGALAGGAGSHQMRVTWRVAAWVISLAAFAGHVLYEQLRRRSSPGTTARHAALAVATGGFGLAVAANVHALAVSGHRLSHTLALLLWPLLAALPALVVALVAATGLSLMRRTK